jgi:hypothetical protein
VTRTSKRKIVAAEHFVIRVQLADAGRDLPKKADEYVEALVKEYQFVLRDAWERDPMVTGPRENAERAEREAREAAHVIRDMRQRIASTTGRNVYETAAEARGRVVEARGRAARRSRWNSSANARGRRPSSRR